MLIRKLLGGLYRDFARVGNSWYSSAARRNSARASGLLWEGIGLMGFSKDDNGQVLGSSNCPRLNF